MHVLLTFEITKIMTPKNITSKPSLISPHHLKKYLIKWKGNSSICSSGEELETDKKIDNYWLLGMSKISYNKGKWEDTGVRMGA